MNLQSKRWAAVAVILLGSVLFTAASAGQTKPLEQAKPQTANQQRIGNVSIEFGNIRFILKKDGSFTYDLINGKDGAKNAQIKSKQFDMAAPRIAVDVRKGVVHTGAATGGVQVEVRQDVIVDNKPIRRVTSLRGDTAIYYAAEPGTSGKPRRIIVRGNVQTVVRSPELFSQAGPLNFVVDSVEIQFLDNGDITLDAMNGKGSGTPLEREPKEKPRTP